MRLLADESCDFAVVRALRAAGHDVKAVVETHRGANDEDVIALALSAQRVLLTEDKEVSEGWCAATGAVPARSYDLRTPVRLAIASYSLLTASAPYARSSRRTVKWPAAAF